LVFEKNSNIYSFSQKFETIQFIFVFSNLPFYLRNLPVCRRRAKLLF